jgi:hypothetical protein
MHRTDNHDSKPPRRRWWGRSVSLCAILAASGVMGAVACSSEKSAPSTEKPSHAGQLFKKQVPAGELSKQLLGAAVLEVEHQILANGAPHVRVVARDAVGIQLGELVIDGGNKDAPISFTARDGTKASAVGVTQNGANGLVTKAVTYRANGAYFTVAGDQQAGKLVGVTYSTGRDDNSLRTKRLPTPDDPAFSDEVNEWTKSNPDFALLDSTRALKEMYVLGMDSAWQQALPGLFSAAEEAPHSHPGEVQSGLHKSPLCSSFMTVIAAGGIAALACTTCGPAGVAVFFTKGLAAFVAIPACLTCVIAVGLSVGDLALCLTSYLNAYTTAYCQQQAPVWADGTADVNEHSCINTCNPVKCQAYCTQQGQTGNSCLGNTCSCAPDAGTGGSGGGGGGGGGFGGSGTGGFGGGPQICIPCTSGQCSVDSHCGITVYCSGSCPPEYDCQYGGCVKTTVTICNCDGTDPPGTCLDCDL